VLTQVTALEAEIEHALAETHDRYAELLYRERNLRDAVAGATPANAAKAKQDILDGAPARLVEVSRLNCALTILARARESAMDVRESLRELALISPGQN
jgi:hypothetical protein